MCPCWCLDGRPGSHCRTNASGLVCDFLHCAAEQQFDSILTSADPNTLVVVDFYRTACGSCKYISAGFLKLCKGSHEGHAPVEFLKHNVFDE